MVRYLSINDKIYLFSSFPEESIPVVLDGGLSTGTLVGIAIGVSVFVLILLVVCCCLYHRQKKQIDEYKQLYFLKTSSDYKVYRNL